MPEISLVENNLDHPDTYNSIPFSADNMVASKVKGSNITLFSFNQTIVFKSWTTVQIVVVLPYESYGKFKIDVKVTENGNDLYTLHQGKKSILM